MRPATIVGSANGRSIRPLTSDLPRNSSRTSTQAISTPITASIAATTTEMISVKRIAAIACGLVIASQNSSTPPSNERTTTAASGISTISVSQATLRPPTTSGPLRMRRAPAGLAGRALCSLEAGASITLRHLAVETPRSCSIFATAPVSGSKKSALTLSQPPNLSILNSFFGSG